MAARFVLDVRRRCLVCDWVQSVTEVESTDEVGPTCHRCRAPTERIEVLARRAAPIGRNEHAVALARLGASRGGLARAASLSPKRRREIAQIAARARWTR